jgi:hypothetical protein
VHRKIFRHYSTGMCHFWFLDQKSILDEGPTARFEEDFEFAEIFDSKPHSRAPQRILAILKMSPPPYPAYMHLSMQACLHFYMSRNTSKDVN